MGVFTPGLIYRFNGDGSFRPFVTGGYSLWFRSSTLSLAYVGGGIDHWFSNHFGVRLSVRDNFREGTNLFEGRIELLIR